MAATRYWVSLYAMSRNASLVGFLCLLLSLGSPSLRAQDPEGVEITYLANEGFLLAAGDDKVLIDALFPGLAGYSRVPEPTRSDLESARPPFDGVDLVLASHFHGDHFGAHQVARHLAASDALFVSTPDAVEKLRALSLGPPDAVAHHPDEGNRATVEVSPALRVTILNLHHGRTRAEIQNLGFLIEIGGLVVLHVGDTEASVADVAPYELAAENIDVALLPGWLLTEASWRPLVAEISPANVVAMHLASRDAPAAYFGSAGTLEGRVARIQKAFPAAWIPTVALESRRYLAPAPSGG